MKNILILNAGTRNKLVSYFLDVCKDKCKVIVTDNFFLAPTLYMADQYYITKRFTEEGYIDDVLKICKENNVGLLVSLIDPELTLLSENKKRFEEVGVLLNTSATETIAASFDKFQTQNFLKENGFNYVLVDTAGRLHIDELLMQELENITNSINPQETILVIDSMMGQDAINVIEGFNSKLKLTVAILT